MTHSEIAHAVGDGPLGPFKPAGVVLPARGREFWDGLCTHNPTVLRAGGKYYLYYMGNTGDGVVRQPLNFIHRNNQRIGVAVADKPEGPWQRFDKPLIDVSPDDDAPDALMVSNPAVCQRPDGTFLMIYKAVGKKDKLPGGGPVVHLTATSDQPTGPFTKQLKPIFTKEGVKFPAEDPFLWHGGDRYYAIVKDNAGYFTAAGYSLALFESADGFDWKPAKHPLVTSPKLLKWADGKDRPLTALERPQLYFEDGRPTALLCAAADRADRDGSFNVQIPLRAGGANAPATTRAAVDPALTDVPDDPKLPRVLLIGDSVSIGYTLDVRKQLAGKANVHRPPANCGSTAHALEGGNLDNWLGDGKWDVIHFNFGLHDLGYTFPDGKNPDADGRYATPNNGGHHKVPPEQYEQNLRRIVARLKATGAKLVWGTTTPVPADLHSYVKGDDATYNEVAARVMREEGVAVDDLAAFARPQFDKIQIPGNPHFTKHGSEVLAGQIASAVAKALANE